MGVVVPHCVATRQPTQTPVTTSQRAVAPTQAIPFVAEQAPHAPLG
jgi:hypothetical protein